MKKVTVNTRSLARRALIGLLALASQSVFASMSPEGLWKTIDEDTDQAKSYVSITQDDGVLSGKVVKILDSTKQDEKCNECDDARKGQSILGMTIITGVKQQDDNVWGDGEILDPKNGKTYTLQLTVEDEGKTLEVRGYIGFFYRNQYWQRVTN